MQQHDDAGRPSDEEPLDLVWGAAEIGRFIGRTQRQAYDALVAGELPGRRVNGRWVASRRRLREHFEGMADFVGRG
jgi:hypothetical protein